MILPLIIAGGIAAAAGAAMAGGAAANSAGSNTKYWETPEQRTNTMGQINNDLPQADYGGYGLGAHDMTRFGIEGMNQSQVGAGWAQNNANNAFSRGPTAVENQQLSDAEGYAAGYDQAGSIQLAREAAMGDSPSEAAWLMQSGLNQGIAAQEAVRGGARGSAGIALAQGNAGANIANLQQNAYTQAGALRAGEMANARGLYNQAANTNRAQDQNRLQMANQTAQFNAQANDQFALGMGGLANQAQGQAANWYGLAQQPNAQQLGADVANRSITADMYNQNQNRLAGREASVAANSQANTDRWFGLAGGLMNVGGSMAGQGLKGK